MILDLIRVGQSSRGTQGVIRFGAVAFCLTLERPWADNQENISCIPPGRYRCERVRSPKFSWTFEVKHVPNRTHVLFHSGNTLEDTHGCILVGEEFSGTWDKPMLASSQRGFTEFLNMLDGVNAFELNVLDPPPPTTTQVMV